jgi:hypothetical protein
LKNTLPFTLVTPDDPAFNAVKRAVVAIAPLQHPLHYWQLPTLKQAHLL